MSTQDASYDERFNHIDASLDRVAGAVIEGVERLSTKLDTKAEKRDLNALYDLMDKIAKQQELDDTERLVIGYQLSRLDRWVHEVADRIGYKLSA